MYKILSLFSGAGGMDLGFKNAGFEIPVAVENDKTIWSTYEYNHKDTKLIKKDIRKINFEELPCEIDGIIGGPPCQSWSVAGKGKGLEDSRGRLFYEYIRILKNIKPKFFVIENVKGMLSKKHKSTLENIIKTLTNCGYNITMKLINAKDYGIAQERERIFIVGFRKDLNHFYKFPDKEKNKVTLKDVIYDLQDIAVPFDPTNKNNNNNNNNEYFVGSFSPRYMSRNRVKDWSMQGYTIQASARQCQIHPSAPKMIKVEKDKYIFVPEKESLYRRLTVRECARIQGFPDNFKFFYKNINDGYKMIGNAVPVILSEKIALSIKEQLNCFS